MKVCALFLSTLLFLGCNNSAKESGSKVDSPGKDRTVRIDSFWIDSSEVDSNEPRQYIVDSF